MKEPKKYGLIRKIDDFGRILLPKDIRQFLNLQEGNLMEISLLNQGIYLEKYCQLKTLNSLCEHYLSALFKSCRIACAICSNEYVLNSKGIRLSNKQCLSEELQKHICRLEAYQYSDSLSISLFDDGSYPLDTVQPIGTKENPLGAVILLHYRNTTPEEKYCAKLIATILTELIQNQ